LESKEVYVQNTSGTRYVGSGEDKERRSTPLLILPPSYVFVGTICAWFRRPVSV